MDLFSPSVTIDKTGDALAKVGDTVNYTISVMNTSDADTRNIGARVSTSVPSSRSRRSASRSGVPHRGRVRGYHPIVHAASPFAGLYFKQNKPVILLDGSLLLAC